MSHRTIQARLILAGLLSMWAATGGAGGAGAAEPASPAPASSKPNIVFVLFDDMGYGQPGCFRAGTEFKTPFLDQLSHESMRFTDAHAAASVCTPTRYGIITGRYPWRIGQFNVLETLSPPIIESTRLTVAGFLHQQGYATACIGKWHLGMNWPGHHPSKSSASLPVGTLGIDGPIMRGFDLFSGYTHARNIGMIIDQDKVSANIEAVDVQPLLERRAVDYIDQHAKAGGPFFLYLALSTPHTPIVPAPQFVGKSGAKEYGDWLYEGDWVLGQIEDVLKRDHLADNTVLFVTSDNGAAGRIYPPLRGCKTSIYEGGHREPFMARWPGHIKPGTTCTDVICLNDLMATCADILKVKLPDAAGVDSVSILPDLLGTATGPVRQATVHQAPSADIAIRQGPWKLVFLADGVHELYNLQTDLSETKNVLAEHADVVDRLTKLMQQYISTGRSTPGSPQKNAFELRLNGMKGFHPDKRTMDQNFD